MRYYESNRLNRLSLWRIQDGFTHMPCALSTTPNKQTLLAYGELYMWPLQQAAWDHTSHMEVQEPQEIVFQFLRMLLPSHSIGPCC